MRKVNILDQRYRISLPVMMLITASLACGSANPEPRDPTVPIAPISIGSDLSQIDLCQAIPTEDIEAVMGRKLIKAPERFEYFEGSGTSGCTYEAQKDSDGEAHFAYIALTPIEIYNSQPLYLDEDVFDIGREAYFNNGAAASELWVMVDERVAFVVAFGDVPNEEGCKAIARLLVEAIR